MNSEGRTYTFLENYSLNDIFDNLGREENEFKDSPIGYENGDFIYVVVEDKEPFMEEELVEKFKEYYEEN